MDETETSDSLGEGSGKKFSSSFHPTKKRRTVDLFARPRSDPSHCNNSNGNSNSNSNRRHPTHLTSCNGTTATATTTTTENFSLETRSRLSSFSDSFSSGSFSGLPAYVVDIPPIPNLDAEHRGNSNTDNNADSNADRGKKTSTPSIRSLLAIRRYISPSLD